MDNEPAITDEIASAETPEASAIPAVPLSDIGPLNWFALRAKSNEENRVKKKIEQRIKTEEVADLVREVVIPVERVSEVKKGKRTETTRKLFPGYIFIQCILRDHEGKLVDRAWYFIRDTPGIIGFADGENPLPMPEGQVEAMLRQMREKEEKVSPKVDFSVGDKVKVGDGPFQNSEGVIDAVDLERGKLTVSVSIFGRSAPVELEFWQVEKGAS